MKNTSQPIKTASAKLLKAMWFAAHKHRDQRRKDPGRTPYINHPLEVACILCFEGGVEDENVLVAALLHDTVEDTTASFEELETHFGPRIRAIVEELTDDKSLPDQERKRLQVQRAPSKSPEAKLVKLADKISNLRDVESDPPVGWPRERCIAYFRWAKRVVKGLRGINPALERAFDEVCESFFSREGVGEDPNPTSISKQ